MRAPVYPPRFRFRIWVQDQGRERESERVIIPLITMIKWIRTSRLSTQNSLSVGVGADMRALKTAPAAASRLSKAAARVARAHVAPSLHSGCAFSTEFVCVREREGEREGERESVCVRERERVCGCGCVRERGWGAIPRAPDIAPPALRRRAPDHPQPPLCCVWGLCLVALCCVLGLYIYINEYKYIYICI